eukprot:CAMPEP_0206045376 /NCGR_PEP_ID=MMETSP1466-20131121/15691_1 /ASSEMBLY_ACC=CAM_ASM_001126 /TAXON_ID=44452 /ORGANISM="Pavlova gyrans, Strain CCMP608" /LENGTH=103 /DNA_ID=CAMNT_0053420311 /DNA_START=102 /DNA_END=415 /DNA_ORIENTATION=-
MTVYDYSPGELVEAEAEARASTRVVTSAARMTSQADVTAAVRRDTPVGHRLHFRPLIPPACMEQHGRTPRMDGRLQYQAHASFTASELLYGQRHGKGYDAANT